MAVFDGTTEGLMNAISTTPPAVRVYAKRPKDRRWKLVGEFDTREAAWSAIVAVSKGYEVWLNDVPKVKPAPAR